LAFAIKKEQNKMEELLKEDYLEMCASTKTLFDTDVFEEYLDLVYQDMADRFMEVNNRRKDEKVSDNS
jgi:hypothetical protein